MNGPESELDAATTAAPQTEGDVGDGQTTLTKRPGGRTFAICAHHFGRALALGINPALAYLALACGSGGDNRTTAWGAEATARYDLMGLRRAQPAILTLEHADLVTPRGHGGRRNGRLLAAPLLNANGEPDLIWLPNRIIGTTPGDTSPLVVLRQAEGNVTLLALLLDIYRRCDLVAEGGVPPMDISARLKLISLGERAAWQVYGVGDAGWHYTPTPSPLARFLPTQADSEALLNMLASLHLIRRVGYVFDRAPEKGGEKVHPVCLSGEEDEVAYARAQHAAAVALLERTVNTDEKKAALRQRFDRFVAVGKHVTNPILVELIRPRWLADTSYHRRWLASLGNYGATAERDAARMLGHLSLPANVRDQGSINVGSRWDQGDNSERFTPSSLKGREEGEAAGKPAAAQPPDSIDPLDVVPDGKKPHAVPTEVLWEMAAIWNEICAKAGLPGCSEISPKRAAAMRARIRERWGQDPLRQWRAYCQTIVSKAFLRGENARGWRANFEWALQPSSPIEVQDGKYDDVQ